MVCPGARVQMAVHEPADQLLLTIHPLLTSSRVRSCIKHTITLLDPAQGTRAQGYILVSNTNNLGEPLKRILAFNVSYLCTHT